MQSIKLQQPKDLFFGDNCFEDFLYYFTDLPYKRVLIVADSNVQSFIDRLTQELQRSKKTFIVVDSIKTEPTIKDFHVIRKLGEKNEIDSVIGLGGGSVLDVAKLVAALCYSRVEVQGLFHNVEINERNLFLACLPTTAGTGSEVSPNSILLDERANLKRGIVSPYLIPDATFVDPVLTHSVPPAVTAATGLDALVHCIEAFANKNAHPIIDTYALQGIKLIYNNLEKAFLDGNDSEARANVALGSMYGGLCLGPVNTAAVHALAYPLGSMYKIAHGVSNAMLLPHVLRANLISGLERYATIGKVLGSTSDGSNHQVALKGITKIEELCKKVNIPEKLTDFDVSRKDVQSMADSALTIQRLLKNNLHDLTRDEIINIYYQLF